jgi:hypothetical protein
MYYQAGEGDYQGDSGFRELISSRKLPVLSGYFAMEIL